MRKILMALTLVIAFPLAAQVGQVSFANSGAPEAQEAFLRGLALLHNFEYSDAAEAFAAAQKIDPSFAMAYWGEAMTHTHPLWFQQDAEAARAVLARAPEAKTERERDYLGAVRVLYGEGAKNDRDFRYAEAMRALHEKYPDDVDATAFYALAVLGTAHEGRDFATYMRAAALLEEVFPRNEQHPGVLHYLIHAYDDPAHAPLGMRAAKRYGAVAPNAGHALHMTSHIFIAMGMWDDVIDANRRAIDVVDRQRAARGKPPGDCGHYSTWLHYGYLQQRRADDAKKALDACRAFAFSTNERRKNSFDEYADMRAAHVASGYAIDAVTLPEAFAGARYTIAYADALAAAQRNDAAALSTAIAQLKALQKDAIDAIENKNNPAPRIRIEVMLRQAEALQLVLAGKRNEAIAILQKAADAERSMPLEFGPPIVAKPAAELLAEQLLAAARPAEAAAAYQLVVARTPGRAVAVEGWEKARKAAGEVVAEKTPPAAHVH